SSITSSGVPTASVAGPTRATANSALPAVSPGAPEAFDGGWAELDCRSQTGKPLQQFGRLLKFLSSATVRITLARPRRLWTRLNSLVSPDSSVVSARVMRAASRDRFN